MNREDLEKNNWKERDFLPPLQGSSRGTGDLIKTWHILSTVLVGLLTFINQSLYSPYHTTRIDYGPENTLLLTLMYAVWPFLLIILILLIISLFQPAILSDPYASYADQPAEMMLSYAPTMLPFLVAPIIAAMIVFLKDGTEIYFETANYNTLSKFPLIVFFSILPTWSCSAIILYLQVTVDTQVYYSFPAGSIPSVLLSLEILFTTVFPLIFLFISAFGHRWMQRQMLRQIVKQGFPDHTSFLGAWEVGAPDYDSFKDFEKYDFPDFETYSRAQKLGINNYETLVLMDNGGFTDLQAFKQAQHVGALTMEDLELIRRYNAPDYQAAIQMQIDDFTGRLQQLGRTKIKWSFDSIAELLDIPRAEVLPLLRHLLEKKLIEGEVEEEKKVFISAWPIEEEIIKVREFISLVRDGLQVPIKQIAKVTGLEEERCIRVIKELVAGPESAGKYLELEGSFIKSSATLDAIDKLLEQYAEWESEKKGKKLK